MGIYENEGLLLEPPAHLVINTSLPATTPGETAQPEGRGTVELTHAKIPPSLFERLENADGIDPAERALIYTALSAYDRQPAAQRVFFFTVGDQTDATTGNVVIPLFDCPGDSEAMVTQVTVDTPESATINPSAPLANAAVYAFLSIMPSGSYTNAQASTMRQGMVAFAPSSAAGPTIPGQWTFGKENAPVFTTGESLFFTLIGGSQASITNQRIRCTVRVNVVGAGASIATN